MNKMSTSMKAVQVLFEKLVGGARLEKAFCLILVKKIHQNGKRKKKNGYSKRLSRELLKRANEKAALVRNFQTVQYTTSLQTIVYSLKISKERLFH